MNRSLQILRDNCQESRKPITAVAACIRRLSLLHSTCLQVGHTLEKDHTFQEKDVASFTATTGDSNPIHCSASAAIAQGLPGCVLPGMLCASLFPAIIGSAFPGALYMSQTLKFRRPAMVLEQLKARVTIQVVSGSRVTIKTECFGQDGKLLLDGTALALMPSS